MLRGTSKFLELRSKLSIGDRGKTIYDYCRNLVSIEPRDPQEYLFAYRQFAQQICLGSGERGSVLLATPFSSRPVAQCSALLASSLAFISRKPVLLVDLSEDGRRLADLIGLTSAMYCVTDERSRFFSISGQWYISTREGIPIGPYTSIDKAGEALTDFIKAPNWIKQLKGESWAPAQYVLPTQFQNLFFLPPAPARLALIHGTYLGDQDGNTARLIETFHQHFGYVMFYGGSILENSLMLSVTSHVNDVIHAVVENQTKVRDVESATRTLQTHNPQQISPILVRALGNFDQVLLSAT